MYMHIIQYITQEQKKQQNVVGPIHASNMSNKTDLGLNYYPTVCFR